jgi:hypothetical protein
LDRGVPDRSQFIRSERLNASDINPDSASCRGFFLPLNHEKDRNSDLTQEPRQEEAEAPCEASEQAPQAETVQ